LYELDGCFEKGGNRSKGHFSALNPRCASPQEAWQFEAFKKTRFETGDPVASVEKRVKKAGISGKRHQVPWRIREIRPCSETIR